MASRNPLPESGKSRVDTLVIWEARDGECRVVASAALLESIRRECVLAARGRVPLGIGGALLGEYSGGTYRLRNWRQIPCRHQRGPSFLLTKEEVGGLKQFLSQLPEKGAEAGDHLIGWFVSHPFTGAVLRDDEISLHQRFFRASDLFLLLEIHQDGIAEVTVHRGAQPLEPTWRIIPSPSSRGSAAGEAATGQGKGSAEPAPAKASRKKPASRLWRGPLVPALALLGISAAVLGWLQFTRRPAPPPAAAPAPPLSTLSLRVQRQGNAYQIRWNPVEPSLTSARRVLLRIHDGATVAVRELSPAEVRAGFLAHGSPSASLEAEMVVQLPDGRERTERVIYGK